MQERRTREDADRAGVLRAKGLSGVRRPSRQRLPHLPDPPPVRPVRLNARSSFLTKIHDALGAASSDPVDRRARTKLHDAAAAGDSKRLKRQLAKGARVDKRDERGSPLPTSSPHTPPRHLGSLEFIMIARPTDGLRFTSRPRAGTSYACSAC